MKIVWKRKRNEMWKILNKIKIENNNIEKQWLYITALEIVTFIWNYNKLELLFANKIILPQGHHCLRVLNLAKLANCHIFTIYCTHQY